MQNTVPIIRKKETTKKKSHNKALLGQKDDLFALSNLMHASELMDPDYLASYLGVLICSTISSVLSPTTCYARIHIVLLV